MMRRKLLALIRTKTPEQALATAEALATGGITSLEIPFTMPEAVQVLKALAARHDLTVGAGTVLNKEQAEVALAAGARFLVCPIGDVSLVSLCREAGAVSVLGALTPTEILMAHRVGADVVKIFPVDALGGARFVRALLEALPPLPLMVEGGATLENLPDYLGLPIRLIALGEALIVPRLVAKGAYAAISARARDYVLLVERRKGSR
ncbi:MAG: 2-dehydro-3-deoxyphosphogluconate aldolase [candidate division NC10 bacterium]|nr:2-dehydro-3-deoxyphosphogluconate aldolase [candidate division NC10 bacterium]